MAKRRSVYIESSVLSYLTARPSKDIVQLAHQEITREWWESRGRFQCFLSDFVLFEIGRGNPEAASRRLDATNGIPLLPETPMVETLARDLITRAALPEKALLDALHLAVCAVHGIDYLLSWNCKHLANPELRDGIEAVCQSHEIKAPNICIPTVLLPEIEK